MIFTVPTIPAAKLSEATMLASKIRFFSFIAAYEKHKFVSITNEPPIRSDEYKPNLFIKNPPINTPIIVAIRATTLTT